MRKNNSILYVMQNSTIPLPPESVLYQHGCVVSLVHDADALQQYLLKQTPQIIVLDDTIQERGILYWIKWLKLSYPYIPVVALFHESRIESRVKALQLGAADCLSKPFLAEELGVRISRILRQPPRSSEENISISLGNYTFKPHKGRLECDGKTIKLSVIELKLMRLLCLNLGKVINRESISYVLYGHEHQPTDRRIDMLVNRLRKKMQDDQYPHQYIQTVWREGYRIVQELENETEE